MNTKERERQINNAWTLWQNCKGIPHRYGRDWYSFLKDTARCLFLKEEKDTGMSFENYEEMAEWKESGHTISKEDLRKNLSEF